MGSRRSRRFRFRPFSHCDIRISKKCYVPNLIGSGIAVLEIQDLIYWWALSCPLSNFWNDPSVPHVFRLRIIPVALNITVEYRAAVVITRLHLFSLQIMIYWKAMIPPSLVNRAWLFVAQFLSEIFPNNGFLLVWQRLVFPHWKYQPTQNDTFNSDISILTQVNIWKNAS